MIMDRLTSIHNQLSQLLDRNTLISEILPILTTTQCITNKHISQYKQMITTIFRHICIYNCRQCHLTFDLLFLCYVDTKCCHHILGLIINAEVIKKLSKLLFETSG